MSVILAGGLALPPVRAPWISGKSYPAFAGTVGSAGAVLAADTLYGYIWTPRLPIPLSALVLSVQTGGAGSSAKAGVWRLGSNGRPVGTPLASNNTGGATTSAVAVSLPASSVLPPLPLFWASVYTGTLPTMFNVAGSQTESVLEIGAGSAVTAVAQQVAGGISTAFTYTGDISALDLTGATWTDVTVNPTRVPILGFTVA